MKLIYALGNPGEKYQHTRHNLGQLILLKYCQKYNISLANKDKFSARVGESNKVIFAQSTSFMNLSGFPLQRISNFYKIDPKDILVIHDDLDLKVGDYKLQFDRSAAGHNGIKSIIDQLGTQAFYRLRVGIDHPKNSPIPEMLVEDYVLLPFRPEEKQIIDSTIDKILPELDEIISS